MSYPGYPPVPCSIPALPDSQLPPPPYGPSTGGTSMGFVNQGPVPYPTNPGQLPYPVNSTNQAPYPTGYPTSNPPYPVPSNPPYPASNQGCYLPQVAPYNPSPMVGYPPAHPPHSGMPGASYSPVPPPNPFATPITTASAPMGMTGAQVYPAQQYPVMGGNLHSGHMGPAVPAKLPSPTLVPYAAFNPHADCEALRQAMRGFGTNERVIVDILSRRTSNQRLIIANQYITMFGKDLSKQLRSELSGQFEAVVLSLLMPLTTLYAQDLHDAVSGLGTNEDTLIEVLCTLDNSWIRGITAEYQRLYKKRLESDIRGDTSGSFQRLLVSMCQGNRDESTMVNRELARQDAQKLYSAGAGRLGTDEGTFNMILASRSFAHLRQVFADYHAATNRTIESAIQSEFSFNIEKGLLAIVKSVRNSSEYFAERLQSSMAGMGTRDRSLIRLVLTRAEIDMGDIKVAFQHKYRRSLAAAIQSDTSGDYKKVLLALIG